MQFDVEFRSQVVSFPLLSLSRDYNVVLIMSVTVVKIELMVPTGLTWSELIGA